jgi:hypothetical protein
MLPARDPPRAPEKDFSLAFGGAQASFKSRPADATRAQAIV